MRPVKTTQEIPFYDLGSAVREIRDEMLAAAGSVVDSGHYIMGGALERFEAEFAAYCRVRHAIGVGNGLDAITLILCGLGIGPGDEVLVPGHTFIATWLAVSQCGATPVAVDIDPATHNIDPVLIPAAITPRTKAILAVHLYGRAAPMSTLAKIAAAHGIVLVEDAAQAHGAMHCGRTVGGLSAAAAFSFYPTKNLGALGDGGAVTTNDDVLASRVRKIRNYGSQIKYLHEEIGMNSRLDELQAAFLSAKLRHLPSKTQRRKALALRYDAALAGIHGVIRPIIDPEAVWHLYVIRHFARDRLQAALAERGVNTLVHYPIPPHQQPIYRASQSGLVLPESEAASREVLSLPFWPEMEDGVVDEVAARLREAAETVGR